MQLYSIMRILNLTPPLADSRVSALEKILAPAPDRLAPLHAAAAADRSCAHVFDPACAACREAFLKIVLPVPKRKPA